MLHTPARPRSAPRALDHTGLLALVLGFALLLCIGGASVWQSWINRDALQRAQDTRVARGTLSGILLAAQMAESAQRGYLLTRDPAYLDPFDRAEAEVPPLMARLEAAQTGTPAERLMIRQVLTAKMAELAQTVRLTRGGEADVAMRLVRSNAGQQDMEYLRRYVARLENGLDAMLVAQVSTVARGGRLLVAIDVAGLVMVLALAGLIALGLRRYLANLRAAQAQAATAYETLERSNDRLDEAVRQRTAELTLANEEIQRFAYIVSHDLRAPLVNIVGFTSELEQAAGILSRYVGGLADVPEAVLEVTAEEMPEALRFIRTSTSKMDRLINAILRLSREGRRVLTPERLDMSAMLRTLADSMQTQIQQRGAAVEIGALPGLRADRVAVEQVFSNVLENAIKYLKPGRPGVIRVDGRLDGDMATYDVCDNGRGIAERDYERVFELFRRSGDQSVPGEGIGLAHVRALVRRLGGSITCQSALDFGTMFTILLPRSGSVAGETAE